ncbi:hypothetical protein KRR26_04615 [Corallococcus sp. M34]|uniref:hypothetical protein n=1 Tax=Citreicoccus inhibens TaxID=2849499 RepID=UPI001C23D255|nr:hypothetical protein [Citreicoccus inhibens]MBU8894871.1 hypothetical protein [Citreicoccus inhibens]
MWVWLWAMQAAAEPAADQINVERRGGVLELSWQDAEDRLQGSFTPVTPRPETPLQLTLRVNSFEGPAFEGPITVTFQQEGALSQQTVTLQRDGKSWRTEFTPPSTGTWQVDVRFRTTRLKVLHTHFDVTSSPPPKELAWALLGAGVVAALVLGARSLLKREGEPEPRVDETQRAVAVTQVAPTAVPEAGSVVPTEPRDASASTSSEAPPTGASDDKGATVMEEQAASAPTEAAPVPEGSVPAPHESSAGAPVETSPDRGSGQ